MEKAAVRSNNLCMTLRYRSHVTSRTSHAACSFQRATCNAPSSRILHLSAFLILAFFSLSACVHQKPATAPIITPPEPSLTCATSQNCFEQAVQARQKGDSSQAMRLLRELLNIFPQDRWTA